MFARKPDSKAKQLFGPARVPAALLLRTVIFALVAIAGATWALVRHYTNAPPPLRVPATPPPAPTFDADAGEIPVPEWLEQDHKGP